MYVRTSSLLHSAKGNCVVTNLLHTCRKLTTTSTFRILPKCITRVNLLTRLSHITEIDHDVLKLRLAFTSSCVGIHNCKSPPLDYSHLYILPSKLSQLKMHSNILRSAIQCHWLNEMSRSHWKDVNILEDDRVICAQNMPSIKYDWNYWFDTSCVKFVKALTQVKRRLTCFTEFRDVDKTFMQWFNTAHLKLKNSKS